MIQCVYALYRCLYYRLQGTFAMTGPPILAESRGHILVLTSNRPEVRNAFECRAAESLEAQIERFEQDSELRVVLVTGGEQWLCAGAHLRAGAGGPRAGWSGR
jgi:enoyl-CoA hydratase/carnithine racemase